MPKIQVGNITMNYDQQGSGEPLVLIPYLAADYACYAFQVPDYSKHFTCISVDLRGTGESDKPGGVYSTEMFADDVAAAMQAIGIPNAHISGSHWGRPPASGWPPRSHRSNWRRIRRTHHGCLFRLPRS
jgi:pimeloyl-ACP methyl ester carboxylesterase